MMLLRLLCSRLRKTNEHVEGALFERLDVRLAKVLLQLEFSNDALQQDLRRVHISQNELASLLGAARESVNKQLHVWQRAGLLDLRKREIVILNRAALEAVIG